MAENKTRRVRVGNLLLDHRNTRIPTAHQTDDQRALLHELVKHEDVATLAKSIAKLGLFPNERMVVMREGRRYVVLEGNRRLAAIKLLLTPELAQTPAQVRVYRKLAQTTDLASLMVIEVVVVADRLEAAPIIAALHTKNPKRRWEAIQQPLTIKEELYPNGCRLPRAGGIGPVRLLSMSASHLRGSRLPSRDATFSLRPMADSSTQSGKAHTARRYGIPLIAVADFLEQIRADTTAAPGFATVRDRPPNVTGSVITSVTKALFN